MTDYEKMAKRVWRLSFIRRAIAFRYLLTPIGTVVVTYCLSQETSLVAGSTVTYRDVYIFGIRIARIQIQI